MSGPQELIPLHGGYRKLKSFQLAQLIYDVTVRFCDRYIDGRSRTHDQMAQAARSGVQNIAEGSQVSGTSKKTELKLTGVARASLEELRRDYEDFLRQRGLTQWPPEHPALVRFKAQRCATLEQVQAWVRQERHLARTNTDKHRPTRTDRSVPVHESPCPSVSSSAQLVANGALSLLNLCCCLLDRQLATQATAFEKEGGFTERLYRVRRQRRDSPGTPGPRPRNLRPSAFTPGGSVRCAACVVRHASPRHSSCGAHCALGLGFSVFAFCLSLLPFASFRRAWRVARLAFASCLVAF